MRTLLIKTTSYFIALWTQVLIASFSAISQNHHNYSIFPNNCVFSKSLLWATLLTTISAKCIEHKPITQTSIAYLHCYDRLTLNNKLQFQFSTSFFIVNIVPKSLTHGFGNHPAVPGQPPPCTSLKWIKLVLINIISQRCVNPWNEPKPRPAPTHKSPVPGQSK